MRFFLLFLLALPLSLTAQPAVPAADKGWCDDGDTMRRGVREACELRTFTLDARDELKVDGGSNGGIRIQGWDRDEILVVARVRAFSEERATAQKLMQEVTISTGGTIEADLPRTHRDDWIGSSFRIYVPRDTDLDLESLNGGIRISSVYSTIRFDTANGGVRLSNLGGDVRGRTGNGALKIELGGQAWDGAGLDVTSGNGSVKLYIPDDYSGRFASGTGNGRLEVHFPITVEGRIDRNVEFTLGEGGPLLRARTGNGSVHIERS
ncbi:MAG: hypothetical protein AAF624_14020 [Bacteroidota bacterium]